jgi:hypothetical protein
MFRMIVAGLLLVVTAGLGFAEDAVTVGSVTLCRSVTGPDDALRPVDARDRFRSDDAEIHALVRLEPVTASCRVRGAWISVDAIRVPSYEIGGTEVAVKAADVATVHFSIARPNNGWPAGNYLLRVTVAERVVATAPFAIEAAARASVAKDDVPAGKLIRHAAGFSFRLPPGWTKTVEEEGTSQLVPPDPAGGGDAPTELYFLAVESTAGAGVRRPDDAQVLAYLDEQIQSLSPVLARVGDPVGLATALGAGTVLEWEATGSDGEIVRARSWVTLAGDNCVMLVAIGEAAAVANREKKLEAIFVGMSRADSPTAAEPPGADPMPPVRPTTADDAALREKLEALDRARDAGILSDEEYAEKRAALLPELPELDDATRAKLAALEDARTAGVLTDEEYAAKRSELLGGRAAGGKGKAQLRRDIPAEQGETYRHPVGFSLWYPARWTLTEHPEALQLAPPDPATTAAGPSEVYLVFGESVAGEGITHAGDAQVVAYLDQQVQAFAPFLVRQGAPKSAAMDEGSGVVIDWSGSNAAGDRVLARARVTIVKEYAVALIALGLQEPVEKREPELKRIFASFRLGDGSRDPQLAGTWSYLTSKAITNTSQWETAWSRAQLASDDSTTLVTGPDGAWTRTKRHYMIAGAGGTWIESTDVKVDRGRWFAGGGRLTLVGDKGSWEDYDYRLLQTPEGVRLLLVRGGTGELWSRTR